MAGFKKRWLGHSANGRRVREVSLSSYQAPEIISDSEGLCKGAEETYDPAARAVQSKQKHKRGTQ